MAKNPLISAPLVNGDGNIGLIAREVKNPLVSNTSGQQAITNPLAKQIADQNEQLLAKMYGGVGATGTGAGEPRKSYKDDPNLFPEDNFVNVTGYLRSKDFGNRSQKTQREMLEELYKDVNEKYPGKYTLAQLATPASKINGALFSVSGDKIKDNEIESSFWQGLGSTAAQALTGTLSAFAGIGNVIAPSPLSNQIARSAYELDRETAENLNTESRKDYIKRRDELNQQGRYAEAAAHMATNPTGLLEDMAIMIGPSLGTGALIRQGVKVGGKIAGRETVEQTAAQRAKLMFRSQMAADGILGAGHTAQNIGAGADGNGDFSLSSQQRLAVFGKGVVDAGLSGFGFKYGINPENLLLRFGKATDIGGAKNVLRSVVGSTLVDAASNTPSAGLDAALATGFGPDGKFDANLVDWDKVQTAMATAATYAPFSGGAPAAGHAISHNRGVARTAGDDSFYNNVVNSKKELGEMWVTADEAQRQDLLARERNFNRDLENNLQERLMAAESLGATKFTSRSRKKAEESIQALREKYRAALEDNPVAMREEKGPTLDDEMSSIQREFADKPLDLNPDYLERINRVMAADEAGNATDLVPPLLLEYKGERTTPLTRAEFEGSFVDWSRNRPPEERANTLFHLEQTDRIKLATEEALLSRIKQEKDAEALAALNEKLAEVRTQRVMVQNALQNMLKVMPKDDPAFGLVDNLRLAEAESREQVLRQAEIAAIERQKVTAAEIKKADSDQMARLAAEQTMYAREVERQIASLPDTIDTRRAQKKADAANKKAAEYLAKAYEKATGEKIEPSMELAALIPAYEARLREAEERLARMREPIDLMGLQDAVWAKLQTPENLGPRDSRSRNDINRQKKFENELIEPVAKEDLATRMLRGRADEQQMAARNNLIRRERAANRTPETPWANDPRFNVLADSAHTASTGLSSRARMFAKTLREGEGQRDPLNVGALVTDRDTRNALFDVNDATGMVALLAERKATAEKMTSGILFNNQAMLNDILAAYEAVHPEAYREGMNIAAKVIQADALSKALPSGEIKVGSYRNQPNPEMLTRLRMGDIFGALEAIKINGHTDPIVQQIINMLKATRHVDPVNVQISVEPIISRGVERKAVYDPETRTIYIHESVADQPYYLVHEATHHATYRALNDEKRWVQMSDEQVRALGNLREMYADFRKRLAVPDELRHAQRDINEFVSEAFSNPQMQAYLRSNNIKVKALPKFRKAFGSLVDAVRRFLGLKPKEFDNLTDIIGLSRMIVGADIMQVSGQMANFGVQGNKVFNSGVLQVPIERSGDWLTIGRIDMLPSGQFKVTIDGEGIQGRQEIFDTANQATEFAWDTYGARLDELSENPNAPVVGAVTTADKYGAPFARMTEKVLDTIGSRSPAARAVAEGITTRLSAQWAHMWAQNIDMYAPFKALDRIADRMGYRDAAGKPLNLYQKMTEGMAQARSVIGRPGAHLEEVSRNIREGLAQLGIKYELFSDYVYAKRAIEVDAMKKELVLMGVPTRLHENPTGFHWTDANGKRHEGLTAANELLSTLSEERQAQFESILKPMRDMNQMLLEQERQSGLISDESYYRLRHAYNYVPLLSEGDNRPSIHKALQGRYTKAADPLANMLNQMQVRYANVARNNALRSLYEMITELGISDLFKLETHSLVRDDAGNVTAEANQKWNDKNGVWVFLGDKRGKIVVDTKTRLGKDILAAIQKPEVAPTLTYLRTVTGYMASNMTTYNPSFLLKTPIWNTVLTLVNFSGAFDKTMSVREHYNLAVKSLTDVVRLLPEVTRDRISSTTDNPMRKLFAQYAGGNNAGAYFGLDAVSRTLNVANAAGPIDILSQRGVRGVGAAAMSVHHRFVRAVHASDEVFRYSAFLNFLEHKSGMDLRNMDQKQIDAWAIHNQELIMQAAKGSRELAGNFTRHGAGKTLPAFFAFWNAGMQSLPLVASIMSTTAGRYGIMGLAILAAASTEAALSDPDDEDTDGGSKFARSPSRKKALCFGEVCAEMPYELRAFMVSMQNLILWGHGKIEAGEAVGSVLRSAVETFVPVQPAGDVNSYTVTRMMIPTVFQPLATIGFGENEFGQQVDIQFPVDWDGKQIKDPANFERGKVSTPQFLKDMTRFFYEQSNGMIDISPARVDAGISSIFGGVYNLLRNTTTPPIKPVGFGDNGVLQTATSSYRYKTNGFAVTQKYREMLAAAAASGRANILNNDGAYNVLAKSDPIQQIEKRRATASRNLKISGMTRSQITGALDKAFYEGDEAAVAHYQELMRQYDEASGEIYGRALVELQEYVNNER